MTHRGIAVVLLSLLLLAAGSGAIALSRTTYTIEGTIVGVRDSPRLLRSQFAIDVRTSTRPVQTFWLGGECEGALRPYGTCRKPEFPLGSRIRFQISDYVNSDLCRIGRVPS